MRPDYAYLAVQALQVLATFPRFLVENAARYQAAIDARTSGPGRALATLKADAANQERFILAVRARLADAETAGPMTAGLGALGISSGEADAILGALEAVHGNIRAASTWDGAKAAVAALPRYRGLW